MDDRHREWREAWLGELKKTREIHSDFRDQIKNDRVYTCEKHFAPEDVEIFQTEKNDQKKAKIRCITEAEYAV